MSLTLLSLFACAAIKSTVTLGQLEEAYHDAKEAGGEEKAVYETTLAEEYRHKAHEEWGYSDYGACEDLATKGIEHARTAERIARYGASDDNAEERFELIESIDDDAESIEETP